MVRKAIIVLIFFTTGCIPSIQKVCANAYDYNQCVQGEQARRQMALQYLSAQQQSAPQPYYMPTNYPVNTSCNGYGDNINCTSYR